MPRESSGQHKALLEKVRRISKEVAAPAAARVDADARFPSETIDALRRERLLSAAAPEALGGSECDLSVLADQRLG